MDRTFDEDDFIRRAMRRGGFSDAVEAAAATWATLAALSVFLEPNERRALAAALPVDWNEALRSPAPAQMFRGDAFFALIARSEHVRPGFAREHAEVVCRVFGEYLPAELVDRLERATGHSGLFRGEQAEPDVPDHPVSGANRSGERSLAAGRPGGTHPLSVSKPKGAHANSVVAPNPHAESKLSSAQGLTQEREHESLATERPTYKSSA